MTETPLDRMAKKACTKPFFFGFRMAEFAFVEGLDDAALAAQLGCDQATLTHLRLCRAPRTESAAEFREDVECIAAKFGIAFDAIAEIAKCITLTYKREPAATDPQPVAVLAARDKERPS